MGKLRKRRTINQKAGLRDLLHATMASALTKCREELAHVICRVSGRTHFAISPSEPQVTRLMSYFFTQTWCMLLPRCMYEYTRLSPWLCLCPRRPLQRSIAHPHTG